MCLEDCVSAKPSWKKTAIRYRVVKGWGDSLPPSVRTRLGPPHELPSRSPGVSLAVQVQFYLHGLGLTPAPAPSAAGDGGHESGAGAGLLRGRDAQVGGRGGAGVFSLFCGNSQALVLAFFVVEMLK